MSEINKFIDWLESLGIYQQFAVNTFHEGKFASTVYLDSYCEEVGYGCRGYVLHAFVWAKTQEGVDFWNKVDDDWQAYLVQCGIAL